MLSEEKKQLIQEMYLTFGNTPIAEIAKTLEVNYQETILFIRKNKLRYIKNVQQKNELLYCIEIKKFTRRKIAERLKIKPEKVTWFINHYKIDVDFREVRKNQNESMIIESYLKEPLSIGDMCRKTNLSYSVVHKIYLKNNLQKVKPKEKHLLVLSQKQYESIINDLVNTDLPLSKIAEKNNVSRQRIHQIQKTNSIQRRKN